MGEELCWSVDVCLLCPCCCGCSHLLLCWEAGVSLTCHVREDVAVEQLVCFLETYIVIQSKKIES